MEMSSRNGVREDKIAGITNAKKTPTGSTPAGYFSFIDIATTYTAHFVLYSYYFTLNSYLQNTLIYLNSVS
jgi:hypothetical protein